eukprot:15366078-Ditylum_brightwellii.AAC.1
MLRGNEERNETITLDDGATLGKMPSFEYDVELVAKTFDWSEEDAQMHMTIQASFSSLVEKLEKMTNFADSEMAMNPGDCVTIYFKDKVPPDAEREIKVFENENSVDVATKVTKLSMSEQEDRAEKIADALNSLKFSSVGYSIGPGDVLIVNAVPPEDTDYEDTPDPGTDEVDLNVLDDIALEIFSSLMAQSINIQDTVNYDKVNQVANSNNGPKDKVGNQITNDYVPYDQLRNFLYGVRLFLSREDEGDTDFHTYGGRQIRSGTSQCTTGFTVVRSNGATTGVATAAHCTGMNMYDASPPTFDYLTFWQAQHNGNWGDFEWHTTPHIEPPEYWASPTQRRFVNAIDNSFSRNNVVCGYSRRRGLRFCDRIYRTNVRQGGTRRLIAMRNRNMVGGDSGGPWSFGTTAAGLVKGAKVIWFRWRDTWSRASYIPLGISGVIVRTT